MPISRRGFLRIVEPRGATAVSGAFLSARGLEAHLAEAQMQGRRAKPLLPPGVEEIRISSNENPLGPGWAALDAILGKFPEAGRYPFNSTPSETDLVAAIAAKHKVKPENVVVGAGSQEILKSAVRVFTAPGRGLITASPSFENCVFTAKRLNHPITEVPVDSAFRLDLGAMLTASQGGGLVFLNNPNNPTATVHGIKAVTEFIEGLQRTSPGTAVLVDEAYHDYVTDPSYESAVPLALELPNVFVTRTFSKAYGMAGIRVGYAIGRAYTIKRLTTMKMPYNVSVFGVAAAIAALGDAKHIEEERARNTDVRAFTVAALREMNCKPADSHGNFLFVEIGYPAKDFRAGCAKSGVMVGRDFPPFEKTHVRISIGTMDDMRKATDVFRSVLGHLRTTTTTTPTGDGK
jgi:histidinol-phosphate aminotransferase